jgi:hypothetical protein
VLWLQINGQLMLRLHSTTVLALAALLSSASGTAKVRRPTPTALPAMRRRHGAASRCSVTARPMATLLLAPAPACSAEQWAEQKALYGIS